jgi:glutamate-1-semialdehyde aminotransferase
MFIGHAHPEVTAAVQAQVPLGTTFFANNRHGIALAEAIVDAVPCAEQVRFVCSGTEADLYAMRAARAFRKRDKILKFEGGYHGMSDYALMSLAPKRPGNFPRGSPDSAGIPKSVAGRDAGRGLQRHRHGRKPDRGAEGRAGRRHRRAVPAPDPAQARLPAGPAPR